MAYVVFRLDSASGNESIFDWIELQENSIEKTIQAFLASYNARPATDKDKQIIGLDPVMSVITTSEKGMEQKEARKLLTRFEKTLKRKPGLKVPVIAVAPDGTETKYATKSAFLRQLKVPIKYGPYVKMNETIKSKKYPQLNDITLKLAQ